MNDDRLDLLNNAVAEQPATYGAIKINRIKISNYKFFYGDFELEFNGKNVLIYGENGSGKSSIFQAFKYLAKSKFDGISKEQNIFSPDNEPAIEFGFSNGADLIIDRDLTELPAHLAFLRGLSIFTPMLDYKQLLKVHYSHVATNDSINVFGMLQSLFIDFPYTETEKLSDITDPTKYFDQLQIVVNDALLSEVNKLISFFDADFKINSFVFSQKFSDDKRTVEPVINIQIDFKDNVIEQYHTFLNEARLSALAMSIYFAAILKLFRTLKSECIKILVLDDLLISLDMSNRLKLLEILKSEFVEFQIFFFTHDKELFELYKNKMDWEKYEIYPDEVDGIPKPLLKPYESEIKRAKACFDKKELDVCAMLLRKEFERFLVTFLTPVEQRNKLGEELQLADLIAKAKAKSDGETKAILERLDSDRKHLFNPSCHHDNRNIFSQEVKAAIYDLEKLIAILK